MSQRKWYRGEFETRTLELVLLVSAGVEEEEIVISFYDLAQV